MACGSDRPAMTRSSSTLSNVAVSLPPSRMIGRSLRRSSPNSGDRSRPSRALHPVDVAAQRVDLAVVGDVAVGMRERPGREGVGAEALVHERQRRLHVRVGQIGERRLDLLRRQHALVDQGARRQAGDVETAVDRRRRQRVDRVLDPLADDVQLALERASDRRDGAAQPQRSAPMKTCSITGGLRPRTRRDGRRRPARRASRAASALPRRRSRSKSCSEPAARAAGSRGRNTSAGAVAAGGGRSMPSGAVTLRRNRSGI